MRPSVFLLAGCAGLFSAAALVKEPSQDGAQEPFSLTKVSGDVGVIVNPSGGNVAVLDNEGGSLIVDTNLANFRAEYQKAFERFAGEDTRFVVNTHWHGDHTGNNVLMGDKGVPVVAHDGVRARLAGEEGVEGRTGKDTPPGALPTVTYDDDLELFVGGEKIVLKHYGAGHTDGDGVVWFHGSKVVHMGDLFFNGMLPFIDLGSGGDARGYAQAVEGVAKDLAALGDPEWRIIPGHGPVGTLEDLQAYQRMLQDCVQLVDKALAAGQSMEQMLESKILADYEEWSWGFISTAKFIETLGTSLAKK